MAFLDTSLVAMRESLEAFLLVGILSGIVVKLGSPRARRPILWGAGAGLGASVLLGVLANGVAASLYEGNAALFEGLASLLAVGILTYMVAWMYKHTRELVGSLHAKAKAAIGAGKPAILFLLSFVAVLREGIETVLFVAGKLPADGAGATMSAVLVGIGVSAVVAFLLFAGVLRLNVQGFFAATGALLVLVGAGLMVTVVHELSEPADEGGPGWLPETPRAWDVSATLPTECEDGQAGAACTTGGVLHAIAGYRADPRWAEVAAWALYVAAMLLGYLVLRGRKRARVHDGAPGGPPARPGSQEPWPDSTRAPKSRVGHASTALAPDVAGAALQPVAPAIVGPSGSRVAPGYGPALTEKLKSCS